MSATTLIGMLFIFTLAGGLIYAYVNKKKTEKLQETGKEPYVIPKAYQKYKNTKESGVGL